MMRRCRKARVVKKLYQKLKKKKREREKKEAFESSRKKLILEKVAMIETNEIFKEYLAFESLFKSLRRKEGENVEKHKGIFLLFSQRFKRLNDDPNG